MLVTIDRFEEDFAVVETDSGDYVNLPRLLVPEAREGDAVRIEIDPSANDERKKEIKNLFGKLMSD